MKRRDLFKLFGIFPLVMMLPIINKLNVSPLTKREYCKLIGLPKDAPLRSIAIAAYIKVASDEWKEFGMWQEFDKNDIEKERIFKCLLLSLRGTLEAYGLLPSKYWGKIKPLLKL